MVFATIAGIAGFISFRRYTAVLPFRLMGGAASYVAAQVVHDGYEERKHASEEARQRHGKQRLQLTKQEYDWLTD